MEVWKCCGPTYQTTSQVPQLTRGARNLPTKQLTGIGVRNAFASKNCDALPLKRICAQRAIYLSQHFPILQALHVSIAPGSEVSSIKGARFFSSGPTAACPRELAWRQQGRRPGTGRVSSNMQTEEEDPRHSFIYIIELEGKLDAGCSFNDLTAWNIGKPWVSVKLGGFQISVG